MEYKIIRTASKSPAEALDLLESKVNEYLTDGWVVSGGPSVAISGPVIDPHSLFIACQAVTKSQQAR